MQITDHDLLNALNGTLPEHITSTGTIERIATERNAVDLFLDNGGQAYGFSTFFGHLDNHPVQPEDSLVLLNSHLIGVPQELTVEQSRAITTMKLSQMAQGGTGISPSAFQHIIDNIDTVVSMDLDASYGSGDVVPGAWWVRSLFGAEPQLDRGDLMAMINGSFVPPGLLLAALPALHTFFNTTINSAHTAIDFLEHYVHGIQLPVSLRDLKPLKDEFSAGLLHVQEAIEHAANQRSGNPTFDIMGTDEAELNKESVTDAMEPVATVWAQSNSSFLGFNTLAAIRRVSQSINVAASYQLSIIKHLSGYLEQSSTEYHGVSWVQVPKVSKAYVDNIAAQLTTTSVMTQWESFGTEDVSDFALQEMQQVLRVLPLLDKLTLLTERCVQQ